MAVAGWNDDINSGFPFQKQWHFYDGVLRLDDGCKLEDEQYFLGYDRDGLYRDTYFKKSDSSVGVVVSGNHDSEGESDEKKKQSDEKKAKRSLFLGKTLGSILREDYSRPDDRVVTLASAKMMSKVRKEFGRIKQLAQNSIAAAASAASRVIGRTSSSPVSSSTGTKSSANEDSSTAVLPESRRRLHASDYEEYEGNGDKKPEPQDVIYGLEHAYYGVVNLPDMEWGDPAIKTFQQGYWMRSFVRILTNFLHKFRY